MDRETGELGVAVQTYWFGVGSVVPWVEPGVGAVATQSFVEVKYGHKGLALMREGLTPSETLEELLSGDEDSDSRQVAMIDASGKVAAHNGTDCVRAFGQVTGDAVSCQANMMENATVWDAMLQAYRSTSGDIAVRMMAALRAAEAEGGDMRGRQSAAMLVAPPEGEQWERTDGHTRTTIPSLLWMSSNGYCTSTKRGGRSAKPAIVPTKRTMKGPWS